MSDQYDAVRYDLALSNVQLTDAELDLLYPRAALKYASNSNAQEVQVRLYVIRNLKAQAAKLYDYQANQSKESLSQIFDNLLKLEKSFMDDLSVALDQSQPIARFGGLRASRPHYSEVPTTYFEQVLPRLVAVIRE